MPARGSCTWAPTRIPGPSLSPPLERIPTDCHWASPPDTAARICGVMRVRICSSSIWLIRNEAVASSDRSRATLVAPAPAAEALSEASALRADSCTCSGEEAVDEENTDCAEENRSDASDRIASLRVSNIDVRSWDAMITPKTRRMISAANVIARASLADRE